MPETLAELNHKIKTAGDLKSVVRIMKVLSASNISRYERAARALDRYYQGLELGLALCFRRMPPPPGIQRKGSAAGGSAVVFGSDQGLVGSFNESIASFALKSARHGLTFWAVGERVYDSLRDAGLKPGGPFPVPGSVPAITALVSRILVEARPQGTGGELYLLHNRAQSHTAYAPVRARLLPLDAAWRAGVARVAWPGKSVPELLGGAAETLEAFVREYLFISLYRACADSLAAENASRLAAMQRADKNIDDLLEGLGTQYHHLRQSGIDEELFDVISGYESLGRPPGAGA